MTLTCLKYKSIVAIRKLVIRELIPVPSSLIAHASRMLLNTLQVSSLEWALTWILKNESIKNLSLNSSKVKKLMTGWLKIKKPKLLLQVVLNFIMLKPT